MNLMEIVEIFGDCFGYVKDIESLLNFLDINQFSLPERNRILFEVSEWNYKRNQELMDRLKKVNPVEGYHDKKEKEEQVDSFQNESIRKNIWNVRSYLVQIRTCPFDFITDILPSMYDEDYQEIMVSILMGLFNEIYLANEMISSASNKEKMYLKEEISSLHEIIKVIKKYDAEETKENFLPNEEEVTIQNRIVYLEKPDGTLYVEDDLNHINIPDYAFSGRLMNSLISNTITREKRFHNFKDFKELSAIRKGNSRILFARLDSNTIAILGIFTKRCQNPTVYVDFIRKRAKRFKEQKEMLKEKINEGSFIEYSQDVTNCVVSFFNRPNEKKLVRQKNGI